MNKSIAVYGFATLALTCLVSSARADLLYTSGSFNDRCSPNGTDGCVPASASASFSLNGSSQLVVILSDTTVNPWQDSQNLGAISFQLQNFGSASLLTGTLVSITGQEILSTPLNSNINTAGNISGSKDLTSVTPWSATAPGGTSMHHGANYTAYFAVGPYSMVGLPTTVAGVEEYTGPQTCSGPLGPSGGCGSSKEFGQNSADDPMIFETATFVFNLTGTPVGGLVDTTGCSTGHLCLSNVQFGFGPDGPDEDDVTAGVFSPQDPPAVPEPSSILLLGTGLIVSLRRLKLKVVPRV